MARPPAVEQTICPHMDPTLATTLLNADFEQRVVLPPPGSQLARHEHGGGEEILVLEGLFRDEEGEYPEGTWLRNPRWSRHTPFTGPEGALIYVKVGHIGAEILAPGAKHSLKD
jgi:anti-sigma factor ChrR (cupin superfamily)